MNEEGKFCDEIMKKEFKKDFVMTRENDRNIWKAIECWICGNDYIDGDAKVRDHSHITGK